MSQEQLDLAVSIVKDAGFTSAQTAMLKTLAQNFVFTTEQAAALVECFSMSDDKVSAPCLPGPALPPLNLRRCRWLLWASLRGT